MSAIDALESELKIDGCYLQSFLSDIALLSADSASDCLFLTANLKNASKTEVILKVSPYVGDDITKDNGAYVEILIYKQLINKLYAGRITPHIIPCLGTFSCHNFIRSIPNYIEQTHQLSSIKKKWAKIIGNLQCNPYIANFMVLPMNYGMSLETFIIESGEYSDARCTALFFQLCYTLHCFNKAGLRHNDLNLQNVLVETNSPVQEISYVVEKDLVFKVPTHGYIAKIFDFDRSYYAHGVKNTGLMDQERNGHKYNMCDLVGTCNEENPVFDIYYITRLFMKNIPEGELYNSIQDIVFNKSEKRKDAFFRSNKKMRTLFLCADNGGEYDWRSNDLPTPEEFLKELSVFQQFRINPGELEPKRPTTFFSDDIIRKSFHVRSRPLSVRPIITKQYMMKCIECSWPGEWKSQEIVGPNIINAIQWLLSLLRMKEPMLLFAAFDEFVEYLQRVNIAEQDELKMIGASWQDKLKMIGASFCIKHFLMNTDQTKAVFGDDPIYTNLKKYVKTINFESKCQSTIEYLIHCESEDITKADQKRLQKQIKKNPNVMNTLVNNYMYDRYILLSPLERAKIMRDAILLPPHTSSRTSSQKLRKST